MTKNRIPTFLAALMLSLAITGCTHNADRIVLDMSAREGLTLEQAKADTQALEQEIAALVPEQYVDRIEQQETGVLLPCPGENNHAWTGRTKVFLTGDPEPQELLEIARAHLIQNDLYLIEDRDDALGYPSLFIIGPHGFQLIVGFWHDYEYFDIMTFSECFQLPEGTWTRGSF